MHICKSSVICSKHQDGSLALIKNINYCERKGQHIHIAMCSLWTLKQFYVLAGKMNYIPAYIFITASLYS